MTTFEKRDHRFTIALLGAREVGKTCYLTRLTTGEFVKEYAPTKEPTVTHETLYDAVTCEGKLVMRKFTTTSYDAPHAELPVNTTRGLIRFTLCDVGQTVRHLEGFHGAIILYDVTRPETRAIADAHNAQLYFAMPRCTYANKVDQLSVTRQLVEPFGPGLSVRSNYNYDRPLLDLARVLLRDDALKFVEAETATLVGAVAGGTGTDTGTDEPRASEPLHVPETAA